MLQSAFHHWCDGIGRSIFLALRRIDAAAIDANSDCTVLFSRGIENEPYLVLPWLVTLVMIEVAGIVADFVDMRGHLRDEAVILLQIDGKISGSLLANLGERLGVLSAIDCNSDHVGPM